MKSAHAWRTPLLLFLSCVIVLVPRSPLFQLVPLRDSGVFLYIAWRMLHGEIPYVAVWDHKGPLIFLINAIGLLIGHNSLWGLWIVELCSLVVACLMSYRLLAVYFGKKISLLITLLWLLGYSFLLEKGNFVEEYALPFQFITLWYIQKKDTNNKDSFIVGLLGGCTFLLRPNLIGVWVVYIYISLLYRHIRPLLYTIGGMVIPIGLALMLLYRFGALYEFYEAVFMFNTYYSLAPALERLAAFLQGNIYLMFTGLPILGIAGWMYIIKQTYIQKRPKDIFTLLVFIGLPAEMILSILSGRSYPHYYLAWIPLLSIASGICISACIQYCSPHLQKKLFLFSLAYALIGIITISFRYIHASKNDSYQRSLLEIVQFTKQHTEKNDYVLVWGLEPSINFLVEKKSPSRFIYHMPLFIDNEVHKKYFALFLSDIKCRPPAVIIDTSSQGSIPSLQKKKNESWHQYYHVYPFQPEVNTLIDYIQSRYSYKTTIGRYDIYVKK